MLTITGKCCGSNQSGGDRRLKLFPIPVALGDTKQGCRIGSCDDLRNGFPDELECLPIAASCKRVTVPAVGFILLGTPLSRLDSFDELRRDAVPFDRQRVIGVALVDILDEA